MSLNLVAAFTGVTHGTAVKKSQYMTLLKASIL